MGAAEGVPRSREELVAALRRSGRIRSDRVAAAFSAVPRHVFLPGLEPAAAYADEAVPTKWTPDGRPISSSSQPSIMAEMLEQLDVPLGAQVLEVGAGTGYNAALLAHLVGPAGSVTTMDLDEDIARQARAHLAAAGLGRSAPPGTAGGRVSVVRGDGAEGWPPAAPYDRIVLTVGARELAPAWLEQLEPDGRLVLPLSLRGVQRSVAFDRDGDALVSVSAVDCGFMRLRGPQAGPDPVRRLDDGLLLVLEDERRLDPAGLRSALEQPGEVASTGVWVTAREAMGGLALWLALHDPDVGGLSATGPALRRGLVPPLLRHPELVATVVRVGDAALAGLTRVPPGAADPFELGVQTFGRGGATLGVRLGQQVAAWVARGRPSSTGLSLRAVPAGVPTSCAGVVLPGRAFQLCLDW